MMCGSKFRLFSFSAPVSFSWDARFNMLELISKIKFLCPCYILSIAMVWIFPTFTFIFIFWLIKVVSDSDSADKVVPWNGFPNQATGLSSAKLWVVANKILKSHLKTSDIKGLILIPEEPMELYFQGNVEYYLFWRIR